tara:strand:- start:4166 stop:9985 length:5820 start_codon:yes stop_codon:yes gene_type:complete
MANEFVARKGLRSLSNVEITGSLDVTSTVTANGVTLTGDQDLSGLIEGVTAGDGLEGGGTSGTVTVSLDTGSTHFTTAVSASALQVAPSFNGNRAVSNVNLPDGIRNINFGTSGSVNNFIEKVFFSNEAPVIDDLSTQIREFETGDNHIFLPNKVTATDTEGQDIVFRTASTYTDGKFDIDSDGTIRVLVKTTESINTTEDPNNGNLLSHKISVEAEDTSGGIGTKDIFIRVLPNNKPKFVSQIGGGAVDSFTFNRSESLSSESNIFSLFYYDAPDFDNVTIRSGSDPTTNFNHFTFTNIPPQGPAGIGEIQINQVTDDLNFGVQSQYIFSLTASDSHFENGEDLEAFKEATVTINIVDNEGPTINDFSTDAYSENTNDQIVATSGEVNEFVNDPNGDPITFSNFTLKSAHLNDDGTGNNITSSLGGTSLTDPTQDPFLMNTSGQITRKVSALLNNEIAGSYVYQVTVGDPSNPNNDTGLITIPIKADTNPSFFGQSGERNIIESGVTNDPIINSITNASGIVFFKENLQPLECDVTLNSTNDLITIDGNTSNNITQVKFKLASNLSGSGLIFDNGDTINLGITASKSSFPTSISTQDFTISITKNNAPNMSRANTTFLNTNEARNSQILNTINVNDPEGDSINFNVFSASFNSNNPSALSSSHNNTQGFIKISSSINANAGLYGYTASIEDIHGFRSSSIKEEFTIVQAESGSLNEENNTFYIIENAQLNDPVVNTTSGTASADNSNAVQLTAGGYNSSQGDPAATNTGWFTASIGHSNKINISPEGFLSASAQFVASPPTPDGQLNCKVHFTDQYGNVGTGSFKVSIVNNVGPTISHTHHSDLFDTVQATTGTVLISASITDPEDNFPFTVTLDGDDASSFEITAFDNTNSSSFGIAPVSNLTVSKDYELFISASDSTGLNAATIKDVSITIQPAGSPILSTVNDDNPFICAGARANEIFTISSANAKDGNIAQRTLEDGDQSKTFKVQADVSNIPGDNPTVTYSVPLGRDKDHINVDSSNNIGSFSVKTGTHISGNFDSGDEIHFIVRGTDNNGSTGDLPLTASVVAPKFPFYPNNTFASFDILTFGTSNNPRGTNVQQSGSFIAKVQFPFSDETINNFTYPFNTNIAPAASDMFTLLSPTSNNSATTFNLAALEIQSDPMLLQDGVRFSTLIRTKVDLTPTGDNTARYTLKIKRKDARGFTNPNEKIENIFIKKSPTLSNITSDSNLFISKGARLNEFILSTEEAAKTGSRFSTNADSSSILANYSGPVPNSSIQDTSTSTPEGILQHKHGIPSPIKFTFDGRDAALIQTGSSDVHSGSLSLKINLSGSAAASQDELHFNIIASQSFSGSRVQSEVFNSTSSAFTASIVDVVLPSASFTLLDVLNTNEARSSTNILKTSLKQGTFDVDKVSPFTSSFSGTGFAKITDPTNFEEDGDLFSDTTAVSSNFTAGDFNLTASIVDSRGFNQASSASFTITQAPSGSLDSISSAFIFEFATASESPVVINSHGRFNGTKLKLGVTYNNASNFGNPQVNSGSGQGFFSASADHDNEIDITKDGFVSASANFTTGNDTDPLNCKVHFEDQFGNIGTGSFVISRVANTAPTVNTPSFNSLQLPINNNDGLGTFIITETPFSDVPFSASLSSTDADKVKLIPQNSNSSSYHISASTNFTSTQTSLDFEITGFDKHADVSDRETVSVSIAAEPAEWYAYLAGELQTNFATNTFALHQYMLNLTGNFNNGSISGAPSSDAFVHGCTIATNHGISGKSFAEQFASGSAGNGIIDGLNNARAFLIASGTILQGNTSNNAPLISNNLDGISHLTGSNNGSDITYTNTALIIVYPSGSDTENANFTMPQRMVTTANNNTGEYIIFGDQEGTANDAPRDAAVAYFDMATGVTYNGRDKFGVMFTPSTALSEVAYFFYAASGSQPEGNFRIG